MKCEDKTDCVDSGFGAVVALANIVVGLNKDMHILMDKLNEINDKMIAISKKEFKHPDGE